jgi:hypothetical protein
MNYIEFIDEKGFFEYSFESLNLFHEIDSLLWFVGSIEII